MLLDQRVRHAATDISTLVNDYRAGAYTFAYTTGQYLYIGSHLPFNNIWFEMGVLNLVAATVSVDIWWANAWHAAVDVVDQTAGLTVNGRLNLSTDIDKSWDVAQRANDVSGLSGVAIYDMYWLRLSWSASLTATTTLKYIGQKLSTDDTLGSYYPDLINTSLMAAFETGKTNWDEQHYMATERVVMDLRTRNIIRARGQMLDYSLFTEAACHKAAELIYAGMGKPFSEQMVYARGAYKEAINVQFFSIDRNADGKLDPQERRTSTSFLRR